MALVNYTGKNVRGIGLKTGEIVRLLPGINEVEDSKLNECKSHPFFPSLTKKGLVQILQDSTAKDGKRTIDEMLTLISQSGDTKFLKKLVESDGRDRVISAAKDQLNKIKNPSKAKAEEADGEHFN